MARCRIFWIVAISLISVSFALFEDCESPPKVKHASIQIEDDEDTVHALYNCNAGYDLQGPSELMCNLDTDEWNADPPLCIKAEVSNEVEQEMSADRQKKKKIQDTLEDNSVTPEVAATLDMTCVQAKVKAPEIQHGFVKKYDKRRKGEHIFLIALYACKENFEFEEAENKALHCSNRKWVGELPTCIALGEYAEEDEEEYDEYEAVDQEGDDEDADEDTDADPDANAEDNHVAPLPPPPPTHPVVEAEESNNEITPHIEETNTSEVSNTMEKEELEPAPVTDVNIVVAPTSDPFTPRVLDGDCGSDKGGCEQKCDRLLFPGENEPRLKCSCFEGFSLDPYDYSSCHDIDECQINNGGCEQICNNAPGSFQCACETGLQIDTLTGKTCVDINECLLRNGHGPCQDTCHNLWSTYRCSCDNLSGTQLATDNHTCEDAGECALNNGGCSHICISSMGRIFCLCPNGFHMPNDGRNCQDVNECEIPEVAASCAGGCENTVGSYKCVPALNSREDAVVEHSEEEEDEDKYEREDTAIVRTAEEIATVNCPNGFRAAESAGAECVDIDECSEGTSGCENCLNTIGSFECSCPAGFDLADDEKTCVDVNECEIVVEDDAEEVPYQICSHGCENTLGSFICTCDANQHLLHDRRTCAPDTCSDLNNPQLNKTRCAYQCVDIPSGTYKCTCPEGYKLSGDLHNCEVAENGCAKEGGYERCAPGTCISNEDHTSFSCDCPSGYSNEVYSCTDIDECAAGTAQCSHECLNSQGSYQCACPGGFRFVEANEYQCEDIDECASKPDLCGTLQCINQPGSFTCLCADGAAPDAATGLCKVNDPCAQQKCSHMCIAENDSRFSCICPEGMILAADDTNCVYVNHCGENNNGCEQICKTEEEGACGCNSGYTLAADGRSCTDIDECQISNGGCHQLCSNQAGGFTCACQQGFEFLDGALKLYCFDIDECALGLHNCGEGLICENLNGSFTCLCPSGYALGLPPVHATLQSLLSSSSASFHGSLVSSSASSLSAKNALSCLDIDECSIANGNCSHFCLNFPGSFQCSCPPGHLLSADDNHTCIIVNSCLHQNGGCSHACNFVNDNAQCSCPLGFTLSADQKTCIDIDECLLLVANATCAHVCENTAGSFVCRCRAGFMLAANGLDCLDIDECENGYGNCTFICINLLGSYACACEAGFELAEDRRTCIDIDECSLGRHDCSHECINVDGSYECTCPSGYMLGENKATCLDFDECMANEHGCSHSCVNAEGTYECTCPEGYSLDGAKRTCIASSISCPLGSALSDDGRDCISFDECMQDNGGCSHICNTKLGCSCPRGFVLSGDAKTCEDDDECAIDNGGCSHICRNTIGDYECSCPNGNPTVDGKNCASSCPAGFTADGSNPSSCVDIDECATPGICQYSCANTNGSYECSCPNGYQLRNARECEDINECLYNNGGCVGAECINHKGSFQCKCPAGQRLAADRKTCELHTELRDQCVPFETPLNGDIHCTKYRHKKKLFYNTKCKVWCNQGYQLQGPTQRFCNASGKWDHFENQCLPIVCPRIPLPRNGIIMPASCTVGKTYMGERCRLQCLVGFVPAGKSVAVCTAGQQWSNNGSTFDCVPVSQRSPFLPSLPALPVMPPSFHTHNFRPMTPQVTPRFGFGSSFGAGIQRPYIKCPRNSTIFLANGATTAHIILQKPLTNLDFRNIESHPAWTKNLQAHLGAGKYVITFRGQDPVSGKRARCQTVINVRHAEAPKISFCTPSFEVTLSPNQAYRSVVWEEPRFVTATTTLKKLYKSRLPGELFSAGIHAVHYEATTKDGVTSRCDFQIRVKAAQPTPAPPMPMIDLSFQHPSPIVSSQLLQQHSPSLTSAKLLAGHESFVICPGQAPVKVTNKNSVNLPVGCILKNVRVNPLRQYMQRRLISSRWTPFSSF